MGITLTILVVIDTDCIGRCKSNYRMIMATITRREKAIEKPENEESHIN